MTIVTPEPTITRDRYGRPVVIPPNGGKGVAYTRCTTYIDVLDDKYNLQQWEKRMVALGLASRPDLLLSVSAHKDDKKALNRICDDAKEAAAASAAATTGTALHALTELVDRGQDLPVLPEQAVADLEAYKAATVDLKAVHIERFTVHDHLRIGGTPDRIVEYGGERYIADIKTGSIEYGVLKIAMQLAVYAASQLYDITSGERTPHGASLNRGIVIHLPAGTGTCTLHWVDIEVGSQAVQVARQVREQRTRTFKDLTAPFGLPERPSLRLQKQDEVKTEARERVAVEQLERMIRACPTSDDVRALWAAHEDEWSAQLTEVARGHIASLPAAS